MFPREPDTYVVRLRGMTDDDLIAECVKRIVEARKTRLPMQASAWAEVHECWRECARREKDSLYTRAFRLAGDEEAKRREAVTA